MTDLYLSDLSDWNPDVNFAEYRDGGRPGVFLKATEGTGFVASTFHDYRAHAHAAGLPFVGLYHFAKTNSPSDEAGHFLAAISALLPGEVAVLDAEVPGLSASWCRAWLAAVQDATGRTPMLYCSWSYWSDVLGSMADYPLWIAAYHSLGHDDPRDSVPNCRFWQYTDHAEVPGVGSCDDSVFRGTVEDLAAIAGGSTTPPQEEKFVTGTHVLTFLHSGLVLDVAGGSTDDGAPLVQWPLNGQKNQLVRFEDAGDGYVYVVFEHSGKVLDHDPGADVVHQWTKIDGNPNQRWKRLPLDDRGADCALGLMCAADSKVLDLPALDTTPGTQLGTWAWNGGGNQLFAVTTV